MTRLGIARFTRFGTWQGELACGHRVNKRMSRRLRHHGGLPAPGASWEPTGICNGSRWLILHRVDYCQACSPSLLGHGGSYLADVTNCRIHRRVAKEFLDDEGRGPARRSPCDDSAPEIVDADV